MSLPVLKLRQSVTFPGNIMGGTGIEATKLHGTVTIDMQWNEFGTISAIPTSPTSNILTFDTATGAYVMVPSHLLGGAVAGIADVIPSGNYMRTPGNWVTADFLQAGIGAVLRTMQSKGRDVVSVTDFGAVAGGDGTANATAFQAAFNAVAAIGGTVYVPAGKFQLNSTITATIPDGKAFALVGAGPETTICYFPTGGGFDLDCQGKFSTVLARDMSITTGISSSSTVGLRAAQTAVGTGDPADLLQNSFTRLVFRADDGPQSPVGNYWGYGLYIDNLCYVNFHSIGYYGGSPASTYSGVGVQLTGHVTIGGVQSQAVCFNFWGCQFAVFNSAIAIGTYTQGITINSCNFTGGFRGIYVLDSGLELDELFVASCQFGSCANGIFSNSPMTNISVIGNYFLGTFPASLPTGVFLNGLCDYVRFIGNTFFIGGAGIDLTATTQAIITGNTFKNLVTGISLRTATSGVNVQSNSYNNVTTHISNLGTGNTLGGGST
jgi:hypothetical protein